MPLVDTSYATAAFTDVVSVNLLKFIITGVRSLALLDSLLTAAHIKNSGCDGGGGNQQSRGSVFFAGGIGY